MPEQQETMDGTATGETDAPRRKSWLSRYWRALAAFIALVAVVQIAGGLVTMPAVKGWYVALAKPVWTPPDWVFGPVWTTLYALIAISGWRAWAALSDREAADFKHPALQAYAVQMGLNLLWSFVFFGMHAPLAGALVILALLIAIAVTARRFHPIDRPAALMLAPYFAWVAYATTLNLGIAWMN